MDGERLGCRHTGFPLTGLGVIKWTIVIGPFPNSTIAIPLLFLTV